MSDLSVEPEDFAFATSEGSFAIFASLGCGRLLTAAEGSCYFLLFCGACTFFCASF